MHKYHIIPTGGGRLAPLIGTLHKGGAAHDRKALHRLRLMSPPAPEGGAA